MKITKVHLTNFKRFTDIIIEHIPLTSKLVVLIGSNGSGKSSLFDAFGYVDGSIKRDIGLMENFFDYFRKKSNLETSVNIVFDELGEFRISENYFKKSLNSPSSFPVFTFYGRTSFRQTPRLTRTALGQGEIIDFVKDSDRSKFFIDKDNRFENDIEKITETILKDLFRSNESNQQIRNKYINPINSALNNIFNSSGETKLQLVEIIPPLDGKVAQITFKKGDSEIQYNYLSAGEKEVFNLLINLLSRGSLYQNTIYFLDEMDLHLNTKLQYNLLKEITENWIPQNCQLWTATHSLGFIEYAKQTEIASIIDFDDLDFDLPQVLYPELKDNQNIYEIAVGKEFLPSLFQHMNAYFVENNDKEYYAALGIDSTIFIKENNRNSVYHKVRSTEFSGIVDRDFLSDDDILEIKKQYKKLFILDYYCIENYLYHPDNLEEYYSINSKHFDKVEYITQITQIKNQIIDDFISTLSLKRTEYPYFGEPEYNGTALQNRFKNKSENEKQSQFILGYLKSDVFEEFYKSLSMKTYCKNLLQRQHIDKSDLAKMNWFKTKIEDILKKHT